MSDLFLKGVPLEGLVYQSVPGFEDHLKREIGLLPGEFEGWGPLFYVDSPPASLVSWHLNTWLNPLKIQFDSINEAAAALKEIQRNWAPRLYTQFRRGSLITSKLPAISQKKRPFPWLLPAAPMGAWTLLDAHTMIASPVCSSAATNPSVAFNLP